MKEQTTSISSKKKTTFVTLQLQTILGLFLVAACVSQQGCATEPGKTTGIGAIAGGVLGAGLGVIVGSQTGDPGAGLALGAAAGTAAGAVFGNEVQARNEDLEAQDELLRRQEDTLKAQQKQLEELRSLENDARPPFRSARGRLGNWNVRSDQSGTGDRSVALATPKKVEHKPATATAPVVRKAVPPRGEERVKEATLIENDPIDVTERALEQKTDAEVASDSSSSKPSSIFAPIGTEAKIVAPPSDSSGEAVGDSTVEKIAEEPAKVEAVKSTRGADPEAEKVAEYMRSAGQVSLSKECEMAQSEVTKADDSSEISEKLFHYRRALRMCPENPAVHTSLGDIYRESGRTEDAEYEYKQALKINPSYAPALEKLKSVKK